MSFNEQCPTSYFGPEEGMTVVNAVGVPVRMTRLQFLRMSEAGHLSDEQLLTAKDDAGVSLQDILDEANGARVISLDDMNKGVDPVYGDLFHRPGCSIQRSGKCICNYIGQWDPK